MRSDIIIYIDYKIDKRFFFKKLNFRLGYLNS